jgi:hypothetical protein
LDELIHFGAKYFRHKAGGSLESVTLATYDDNVSQTELITALARVEGISEWSTIQDYIFKASSRQLPDAVVKSLEESYREFRKGAIRESLRLAHEAKLTAKQLWPDPRIFSRLGRSLIRYNNPTQFDICLKQLLEYRKTSGMIDDNVRRLHAESLWRKGKLEEAKEILDHVEDKDGYNINCMKGMCKLLS